MRTGKGSRPCHDPTMEPADTAELRAAVDAERQRVEEQITSLQRTVDAIVEAAELTFTDDEHDPEGATIAYERAQALALLRQAREDLVALGLTQVRIDDGTATTCESCDGPIPVERLLALPGVRRCVTCAS